MTASLARLQAQVGDGIPLAQAAQITLALADDGRIRADAPFDANRNMHGSAFGGSLYIVALVCGFAQSNWLLNVAGLDADIVVQNARTWYNRPVHGPLSARIIQRDPADEQRYIDTFQRRQRARIDLTVVIDDAAHTPAAFELTARFVARARSADNSAHVDV
ncbi:YiiD C-terminal domain-containing protein [Salinisphaera aquimarina]|uniref:YiiD C-terminal domain-containing protein n=1 Tax=Salinisphaera aquimarina TaxID=2094031 RepID=A0ABV7EIQ9_9GAMM